jgi:hypothetical protein
MTAVNELSSDYSRRFLRRRLNEKIVRFDNSLIRFIAKLIHSRLGTSPKNIIPDEQFGFQLRFSYYASLNTPL